MSPSRKSRSTELMGNHQRSWIWGRHAVLEALRSARWTPTEIVADEKLPPSELAELRDLCRERDVPLQTVAAGRLTDLSKVREHQGLLARLPAYPYEPESRLDALTEQSPLFVVLDSFHDPFNFGAALRCAEVFGASAVVVGSRRQCDVTSQVVRSSAGAVHHLQVVRCAELTETLARLQSAGVRLVAASEKGTRPLMQANLTGPVALIIGNEGSGIAPERLALCDEIVTIPQHGQIDSLNAAVAVGVCVYEATRQRSGSPPANHSVSASPIP